MIRLEHVATAKTGQDAHDGEHDGKYESQRTQPKFRQSGVQITHRPSEDGAVRFDMAVFLTECAFDEFAGHAEDAAGHHPEERSRTANCHGDGHARDIPQAHRGGEGRGECLKVCYLTWFIRVVILTSNNVNRVTKTPNIEPAHIEREEYRPSGQPEDYDGRTTGLLRLNVWSSITRGELLFVEHELTRLARSLDVRQRQCVCLAEQTARRRDSFEYTFVVHVISGIVQRNDNIVDKSVADFPRHDGTVVPRDEYATCRQAFDGLVIERIAFIATMGIMAGKRLGSATRPRVVLV